MEGMGPLPPKAFLRPSFTMLYFFLAITTSLQLSLYKLKNEAGPVSFFNELSAVSFQLLLLKDVTDSGMAVK